MALLDLFRGFTRPRTAPQGLATSTLRNPASWLLQAFGISTTTPSVSTEEAWRVGAVFACIALRSRVIGSLPCAVYQKQPDGSRVKVGSYFSPGRAISKAPNPYMPPNTFWQGMIANLDTYGNAYAEIEWMNEGDPNSLAVGLWPIPAKFVSVQTDSDTGRVTYEILPIHRVLQKESVLHLRTFAFDGLNGVSRLQAAAKTVGLAYQTEEYGANWYNNGGVPSGVLEHPGTLSPAAADNLRNSWQGMHGSSARSARVAILQEGMKYNPITVSPADAQFLEVRKYSSAAIAALYGVPARLIGAHDGPVGWGSVEQETLEWVKYGLTPDLVAIEQELNTKLLKNSDTYYAHFNLDALLRADMKSRSEALAVQWEHGIVTANEWRALEDMGPVADGMGDVRHVPLNFCPANREEDLIDARIAKGDTSAQSEPPGSARR